MGMSRHTFYHHMRIDPAFSADIKECSEEYADRLELVSRTHGLNPEKGFMDRCMQLRHLRPEKYAPPENRQPVSQVIIQVQGDILIDAKKHSEMLDAQIVHEVESARKLGVSDGEGVLVSMDRPTNVP
jgi:hypothetical protein